MTFFRSAVRATVWAAAAALSLSSVAQAQTAPATASTQSPPPAAASAQTPPAAPPLQAGFQDGFFIQTANGDTRLVLGMVAQMDGRFSLDDPLPITNTFTIRKLRPTFTGQVARFFTFKFMPDFGNAVANVQDAYFDIRFSPKFRVRTGKDKTPIGYELIMGDAYLLFPERSLASSLVPNRDIGVQAQGDLAAGRLFYAGGVFNGIPDGSSSALDLDSNSGKDLAGRIVVQPFRSSAQPTSAANGLGFQIGGSTGQQSGALLPLFRTSVGQTYFSYLAAASANGNRNRVSPAVFYYYKAFGGFAEYMRSTQAVAKDAVNTDVTNHGWDVTGSYVVTGEAATDRGVRPTNNFDPTAGRWGALQIVGRYSELHVDPDVFSAGLASATANQKAQSFTIAANWYPVAYIKYYATFERTKFSGGNAARPTENVILFRTQLAF